MTKFIQVQTQKLSNIINDFMNFNKDSINDNFVLYTAIKDVYHIIKAQLKTRSIKINIDVDKKLMVYHNKKAIEHTLINLLINTRDAFEENGAIEDKLISIYTQTYDDGVNLIIEDNAGGISDDIINKIFNPYFTTKKQGKGTGIGLYMTKMMVEKISGCSINVESKDSKTIFIIKFKNKKLNEKV